MENESVEKSVEEISKVKISKYTLEEWIKSLTRDEFVVYGPDMHRNAAEEFMRVSRRVAAEMQRFLK